MYTFKYNRNSTDGVNSVSLYTETICDTMVIMGVSSQIGMDKADYSFPFHT